MVSLFLCFSALGFLCYMVPLLGAVLPETYGMGSLELGFELKTMGSTEPFVLINEAI